MPVKKERFPGIANDMIAELKERLDGISKTDLTIACLIVPYLDDLDQKMTDSDAGIRLASKIALFKTLDLYDEDLLTELMDQPGLFT